MTERPKKTRPRRSRRKPDPLTAPDEWLMENAMACWHALAPLDETARRMEAKWGVDRLPALVSEETAAKFGQVLEMLDRALEANDLEGVQRRAANARRGWQAMDAEAESAGHAPPECDAWPVRIGDEEHAGWIVKDPAAARKLMDAHPGAFVYTLDEIGRLLSVAPAALASQHVKAEWPSAEVVSVRQGAPA